MKVQINPHSKQVFSPKQCAEGHAFLFIILAFMLLLYGGYEYNLHIMKSFFSKKISMRSKRKGATHLR